MPQKPSNYPRWEGTTTEPTEPKKTAGFAGSEKPAAEHFNWLFNLVYLWLQWLAETIFSWSDLFDPMISKLVSSPTTGGGTLVSTSGEVYALFNDRRVYGASEAHTYTASKDTYVDLSQDGVWAYSEVANGASPPSLAANHFRVFKVVSDGAEVTSVVTLGSDDIMTTVEAWFSNLHAVNLTASTSIWVPGSAQMTTLQTRHVWIGPEEFAADLVVNDGSGGQTSWTQASNGTEPSGFGLQKLDTSGLTPTVSASAVAHFGRHVPEGAVITAVDLSISPNEGSTGHVRAAVVRLNPSTGVVYAFKDASNGASGTAYDSLTGGAQVASLDISGADESHLTVLKSTFAYLIWVGVAGDATPLIMGAKITYTFDEAFFS